MNYTTGFERLGIDLSKVRGKNCLCPKCSDRKPGRRDKSLSIDLKTGHYKCHRCDFEGRADSQQWIDKQRQKDNTQPTIQITDHERKAITRHIENQPPPFTTSPLNDNALRYLDSRGIKENAIKMAKLAQWRNALVFNYYQNGKIVNAKYRVIGEKVMWQHKNTTTRVLWGIDNIKDSDSVIICEGEIDVLSFYQIGEFTALSISQGAPNAGSSIGTKLKCLENCTPQLKDKKQIILAVDNDANGKYLEQILINRFGADRCKVVKYPEGCKDANDVLVEFGEDKLKQCLQDAQYVPIEGVTEVKDVREELLRIKREGVRKGIKVGINVLDDHFSFYPGWWNLFTGIPGSGKSEFVLFLMVCMSYKYGWKWAVFSPEHWPASDYYLEIIEKFTGLSLEYIGDDDFELAMDFVQDHFYFVYHEPKEGAKAVINSLKNITKTIKELTLSKGINGFLIDPYNQLTKGRDAPKNERTDQSLERCLGDVDRICKIHGLCGNIVAHPRTIYEKDTNGVDYKCPTIYGIAGGAMWYNKCYTGSIVHREFNQSDKSSPNVLIDVQKVKNVKRVGSPAAVRMKFSRGWYIGENEDREQCILHGAFNQYKFDVKKGKEKKAKEAQQRLYTAEDCPF
jgi:twinkle protein